MKMRPRSNKTWETDMYIIRYFHTPHIVVLIDLLHIVLEKSTKLKNLTLTNESWNSENEVKVRWHLPVGHVHLNINPYTKYSRPFAYRIRNNRQKHNKSAHAEMYRLLYLPLILSWKYYIDFHDFHDIMLIVLIRKQYYNNYINLT